MRYEFIDPFVSATVRILAVFIPGTARRGEITMLPADKITGDVRVTIGVVGDNQGDVVITMDTSTALRICSCLLGGKISALGADGLDALAELGNIIAGNAVSALNDLGFDFSMEPPRISVGESLPAGSRDTEALQIPLASVCGDVNMHVLLSAD